MMAPWRLRPPRRLTFEEDKVPEIIKFFRYDHLPEHLQQVSKPFGELAEWMVAHLPNTAERSAGLRKLLEAKDCAVRAHIQKEDPTATSFLGE